MAKTKWDEICEAIDALNIEYPSGGEPATYEAKARYILGWADTAESNGNTAVPYDLTNLAATIRDYDKRTHRLEESND